MESFDVGFLLLTDVWHVIFEDLGQVPQRLFLALDHQLLNTFLHLLSLFLQLLLYLISLVRVLLRVQDEVRDQLVGQRHEVLLVRQAVVLGQLVSGKTWPWSVEANG